MFREVINYSIFFNTDLDFIMFIQFSLIWNITCWILKKGMVVLLFIVKAHFLSKVKYCSISLSPLNRPCGKLMSQSSHSSATFKDVTPVLIHSECYCKWVSYSVGTTEELQLYFFLTHWCMVSFSAFSFFCVCHYNSPIFFVVASIL